MGNHAHLSRGQIHERISARRMLGKPVGQLISTLRGRNAAKHRHLSSKQIKEQINHRDEHKKPVGQLWSALWDRIRSCWS